MILGLLPIVTFQTGRAKTEPLSTRNEQSFRVIRGQKGTGNHLDEEVPAISDISTRSHILLNLPTLPQY